MARTQRRLIAAFLVLAGCLPIAANGAGEAATTTPESLLWTVRLAYGQGDFASAWAAQTAFLRHPERNEVDYRAFMHCFIGTSCPSYGLLGASLGKGREPFATLPPFCPEWKGIHQAMKANPDEDEDEFPKLRDQLIQATFKGDCDDWRARTLKMLHPQSVPRPPPPPQAVPLALTQATGGGVWPRIQVQIAGRTAWMLVDTGASYTSFDGEAAQRGFLPADLKVIEWIPVKTFLGYEWRGFIRLPSLQASGAEFRDTLALVSDREGSTILGMNILMRYRSVCFAWTQRTLHLGELGPCAKGAQPHSAFIAPKFSLHLEVPVRDGPPAEPPDGPWRLGPLANTKRKWRQDPSLVQILVDTGTPFNECTTAFIAALGGDRQFEFGDGLTADCFPELDRLAIASKTERESVGAYTATLGMHGLLQFEAFGWRRNPLKLYFVPKTADAGADAAP